MMFWKKFKESKAVFSSSQKIFLGVAALCNFLISMDYGIIRPVSNSLFLSTYTNDFFPYVWLATVPLNLALVGFYNKFLSRLGIMRMVILILSVLAGVNTFCALFMEKFSFVPFFFYVWKEVYIMLLIQQLWSIIHSSTEMKQAKLIYGLIFAIGALGSIIGSFLVDFLAVKLGSSNLLLGSLPTFLVLIPLFIYLLKYSKVNLQPQPQQNGPQFKESFKSIYSSKQLSFILGIVLLMQLVTTLTHYQFNSSIETLIADKDIRSSYCGKIFGIVNIGSFFFQLVGSFLLIHFVGLRRSHFLLPLILALNALGCFVFPSFMMISFAFITIKTFDFSLFGILKEMLYINLKKEEKFQAKAIIDVFAYRSSKALASCLILSLQLFGITQLYQTISSGIVLLLMVWILMVYKTLPIISEEPPPSPQQALEK